MSTIQYKPSTNSKFANYSISVIFTAVTIRNQEEGSYYLIR